MNNSNQTFERSKPKLVHRQKHVLIATLEVPYDRTTHFSLQESLAMSALAWISCEGRRPALSLGPCLMAPCLTGHSIRSGLLFSHVRYLGCYRGFYNEQRRQFASSSKPIPFSSSPYAGINLKESLTLPTTTFPMRAGALVREPEIRPQITDEVQAWQSELSKNPDFSSLPTFTLHDGPPYANGALHLGHFLNKTLKDIVNRYHILKGYRVNFVPGWDCHGLPIELKALSELLENDQATPGADKTLKSSLTLTSPQEIRERARNFALGTVEKQKREFQEWGILGDWENCYRSLDPAYEARQLRLFGEMHRGGLIYRGLKPVHWSTETQSALAEAELEYNAEHRSSAIYVSFPLAPPTSHDQRAKSSAMWSIWSKFLRLEAVIWTTTPWTIPANQAICYNSELIYAVVNYNDSRQLLIAKERLPELRELLKAPLPIALEVAGSEMAGLWCHHPWQDRQVPLLPGRHVTTESGTGLVHTAPAHGPDDYLIGVTYGLSLDCMVDAHGRFTKDADTMLKGEHVHGKSDSLVIEVLKSRGLLLHFSELVHRYPYCWRTHRPVIFRATNQWFARCGGDNAELQKRVLQALEAVHIVPASGRNRLEAFLKGRKEWCISRQRCWGVPIPVFYHKTSGEPLLNEETIDHVATCVHKHPAGTDCWWEYPVEKLLPPGLKNLASEYEKGTDTLDVWFDSGSSWAAVLEARGMPVPADLYLEGSDQHRGWFQSSLLTRASCTDPPSAPYRTILTHGFVLDEQGRKMSKSLGNVLSPDNIIKHGTVR
eukprot:g68816.t1